MKILNEEFLMFQYNANRLQPELGKIKHGKFENIRFWEFQFLFKNVTSKSLKDLNRNPVLNLLIPSR